MLRNTVLESIKFSISVFDSRKMTSDKYRTIPGAPAMLAISVGPVHHSRKEKSSDTGSLV